MTDPTSLWRNNAPGQRQFKDERVSTTKSRQVFWAEVEPEELAHFINKVTSAGMAVSLSRTRDGGALALSVLCDDRRVKEYPTSSDEALALFSAIIEKYVP